MTAGRRGQRVNERREQRQVKIGLENGCDRRARRE